MPVQVCGIGVGAIDATGTGGCPTTSPSASTGSGSDGGSSPAIAAALFLAAGAVALHTGVIARQMSARQLRRMAA